MELYWNFFGKINPAGFLHMFSLGAVSCSENGELESASGFRLCTLSQPYPSTLGTGLCQAKLLPLTQTVLRGLPFHPTGFSTGMLRNLKTGSLEGKRY